MFRTGTKGPGCDWPASRGGSKGCDCELREEGFGYFYEAGSGCL
jgi:hypothetical protein